MTLWCYQITPSLVDDPVFQPYNLHQTAIGHLGNIDFLTQQCLLTPHLCSACFAPWFSFFLFKGKITLRQYWFSLLSFRSPIFFLLTCKNAHTLIPFNKHTTYVLDWWVGIFEKCCFFFYFRFIHHLNGKDKNKKDLSVVYSLFSNS